jgi:hypothetical protein
LSQQDDTVLVQSKSINQKLNRLMAIHESLWMTLLISQYLISLV